MTEFRTVTKVSEISPGQMRVFEVNGDEVVVANVGGVYYAFDNTCPHEGGPLGEGELEDDNVTCPWHFTKFDVKTGAALEGVTNDAVPTYEIRLEGDDIQVRKP